MTVNRSEFREDHTAERCCFALGPCTTLDAILYGIVCSRLRKNDIHGICDRVYAGEGGRLIEMTGAVMAR